MKITSVLKLFITLGLLSYLLFAVVDIRQILSTLTEVHWPYYILAYGVSLLGVVFSTKRWQSILVTKGATVSYANLLKYYFIGIFYNNFLPGTIGGDAIKMYQVGKFEKGKSLDLGSSVFIDRFLGLLVVYVTALVVSFYRLSDHADGITMALFIILFLVTLGIILVFSTRLNKKIFYFLSQKIGLFYRYRTKFFRLVEALNFFREFKENKAHASFALLFAMAFFFICFIGQTYFLLWALGEPLSYFSLLTFLPILNLLVMVPISFGGVGVRESLLVYFLGEFGIAPEKAMSVGILLLSLKILNSFIGASLNLSAPKTSREN